MLRIWYRKLFLPFILWLKKNNNTLLVNCPRDIGTMHADLTKLRQTLFNLLSNASKFTEKGTDCPFCPSR